MEQNFFKKYRIFFLAGLVVLVFAFGANLLQFTGRNITLTVWGTHLSEQEFNTYVGGKNIRLKNTQVTFEYQEIKPEEYEQKLFNAFIRNESPDIFMVNNFQLGQFGKLIYPFNLDNKSYNIGTIQRDFPTIIEKEAVISNYLYISPLSIDTLALYYNRNIFDSLAIPAGPRTWTDVRNLIPRLRQLDNQNRLQRAVIGMGDSSSIKNASDILSLLIMQSNGQIINETRTRAVLNDNAVLNNQSVNPGQNALNFYCDFYQPTSQFYGWSRAFGNDLDAFAQNRLAMFIGYFKDREMISQKNPNLRFGVSEMPNIANSPIVNFGRFWGFSVSAHSKQKDLAWTILNQANNQTNLKNLHQLKKLPPAHRTMISFLYDDIDLGVFARQTLNAKSFYNPNHLGVDNLFKEAIDQGNSTRDYREAINRLNQRLTTLLSNY